MSRIALWVESLIPDRDVPILLELDGMLWLTWHGDHGCAGPQHVHAGGVTVAERRVQADVGQLAAPHVLLFGGDGWEDDAAGGQAHVLGVLLDVGFAHGRETQQPEDAVRYTLQNLSERKQIMNRERKDSFKRNQYSTLNNRGRWHYIIPCVLSSITFFFRNLQYLTVVRGYLMTNHSRQKDITVLLFDMFCLSGHR